MTAEFIDQFKKLTVDRAHPPPKVHKPCMLLAVIDLAERGVLSDNDIRYEDTLEGFAEFAQAVRPGENLEAYFPFYHLKSEPFWNLRHNDEGSDEDIRPRHRSMVGRRALLASELHNRMVTSSAARSVVVL